MAKFGAAVKWIEINKVILPSHLADDFDKVDLSAMGKRTLEYLKKHRNWAMSKVTSVKCSKGPGASIKFDVECGDEKASTTGLKKAIISTV